MTKTSRNVDDNDDSDDSDDVDNDDNGDHDNDYGNVFLPVESLYLKPTLLLGELPLEKRCLSRIARMHREAALSGAKNRTNNSIADRALLFRHVPSFLQAATFRSPTLTKTRRIVHDDDDMHDSDDDDNDDNGGHDDDHGDTFLVLTTSA